MKVFQTLFVVLFLFSCAHRAPEYKSDHFLVILVEARQLDYSCGQKLLKTIAKHPRDGSKNSDVGHAWIYLQGGDCVVEGGHSGELGLDQARYCEGVMQLIECGDPDPVRYLWSTLQDGFFQRGPGRHRPTYAARVDITPKQFEKILLFIDAHHYDYSNYAITVNQCATFVTQVAQIAGLDIDCEVTVPIEQYICVGGYPFKLWTDPIYSSLVISSPDRVETSLQQAVKDGRAECALDWYRRHHQPKRTWTEIVDTIFSFPARYQRYRLF